MSPEAKNAARFINPSVFHLQKLGLELKCPVCMNLLSNPLLLPCNHIFCKPCVPESNQFKANCAVCQNSYADEEIRPASYMENVVSIYKTLSASFNSTILPLLSDDSGEVDVSVSTSVDQLRKKLRETASKEESKQTSAFLLKCVDGGDLSKNAVKGEVLDVLEANQAPELSPDSTRSYGDEKDAGHSSDIGSRNGSTRKNKVKRSSRDNLGTYTDVIDPKTFCEGTLHARESKRQKKLNYGPSEAIAQIHGDDQHISSHSDPAVVPNCDEEHNVLEDSFANASKAPGDASYISGFFCAFCNSSKISEETGPLLHYANGIEVARNDIAFSKAIHVHKKCIDWSPQVYFVGETIKNLEKELARASKLKCTSCGLKGAALGCFAKSCRKSYHVPCAVKVPNCRWDCDDFLMLCPAHKSIKFPRERSNSRKCDSRLVKQPLSSQRSSAESSFWANYPTGPQEWVFCGSSLSSEEKVLLMKFASACGATVLRFWSPKVTHVIAATDSNGACSRTLKVLMAILNGRWVLPMDWVKISMKENCPEPEESYEVNLDNHGCCDGPKLGRLRVSNNAPKLFSGLSFYLGGEFDPAYKNDILDLVTVGGGTIIQSLEQALKQRHNTHSTYTNIVVYNRDKPREGAPIEASSSDFRRFSEARNVAKCIDAQVIPHTWVLESIAACKVLPYTRC